MPRGNESELLERLERLAVGGRFSLMLGTETAKWELPDGLPEGVVGHEQANLTGDFEKSSIPTSHYVTCVQNGVCILVAAVVDLTTPTVSIATVAIAVTSYTKKLAYQYLV